MTAGQLFRFLNKEHTETCDSKLKRLLSGEYINHGVTRTVDQCKIHPDYVVKYQYCNGFHNAIEFEMWEAIQFAPSYSKWFATSIFISKSGRILVQEKVDFSRPKSDYPKKIPYFLTDIKYDNYGFVGNQLKCVDYGNVLAMLTGNMTLRMRRAKW